MYDNEHYIAALASMESGQISDAIMHLWRLDRWFRDDRLTCHIEYIAEQCVPGMHGDFGIGLAHALRVAAGVAEDFGIEAREPNQ